MLSVKTEGIGSCHPGYPASRKRTSSCLGLISTTSAYQSLVWLTMGCTTAGTRFWTSVSMVRLWPCHFASCNECLQRSPPQYWLSLTSITEVLKWTWPRSWLWLVRLREARLLRQFGSKMTSSWETESLRASGLRTRASILGKTLRWFVSALFTELLIRQKHYLFIFMHINFSMRQDTNAISSIEKMTEYVQRARVSIISVPCCCKILASTGV